MSLFSFLFGESTARTDNGSCVEQKPLVVSKNGDVAKQVAVKKLIIQDGVTEIGMHYSGNKSIEELDVPCSVGEIPRDAFKGCSRLKRVVLQNGVRKISKGAFKDCEALTYIKIPCSIKSIESDAFSGCSCLSTIEIDDISSWLSVSCPYSIFYKTPGHEILVRGVPYTEFSDEAIDLVSYPNREAFVKCSSLRSIVFTPSTKRISLSFSSCLNVEKIVLPDFLEYLRGDFCGCSNVKECKLPKEIEYMEGNPFHGVPGVEYEENGILYACDWCVGGSVERGASVRFKHGTIGIAGGIFISSQAGELLIPRSVKKIGNRSFQYMYELKKIVFEGRTPICGPETFYRGNDIPVDVVVNDEGWRRVAKQFAKKSKFKVVNTGLLQEEFEREEAIRRAANPRPPAQISVRCEFCHSCFNADRYDLAKQIDAGVYKMSCQECGAMFWIPKVRCPLCGKFHVYGVNEEFCDIAERHERCCWCGDYIKVSEPSPQLILQDPTAVLRGDVQRWFDNILCAGHAGIRKVLQDRGCSTDDFLYRVTLMVKASGWKITEVLTVLDRMYMSGQGNKLIEMIGIIMNTR